MWQVLVVIKGDKILIKLFKKYTYTYKKRVRKQPAFIMSRERPHKPQSPFSQQQAQWCPYFSRYSHIPHFSVVAWFVFFLRNNWLIWRRVGVWSITSDSSCVKTTRAFSQIFDEVKKINIKSTTNFVVYFVHFIEKLQNIFFT